MKKLKDVEAALANFFASGGLRLADKLGPILWQFPERMPFNEERFARFLEMLPRTHAAAAELSRGHDQRMEAAAGWRRSTRGPSATPSRCATRASWTRAS